MERCIEDMAVSPGHLRSRKAVDIILIYAHTYVHSIQYMYMEFTVIYRNQSEVSKLMEADGRRPGLVKSLPTSSLAEVDTVEKYSAGKEKSHRRMLLVVSSSESSRNGESPLQYLVLLAHQTSFPACLPIYNISKVA